MKWNINKTIEIFYLLLFLTLFIWAGFASILDHRLIHDFPHGYFASDAFQHEIRTDQIKYQGHYKYVPFYTVGGKKDAVGYYPALFHFNSAILSKLANIEGYDAAYLTLIFFVTLSPFAMYYLAKRISNKIAILSLPFSLLIFSKGTYVGLLWGYWPTLVSLFFVILCLLVMNSMKDVYDAGLFAVLFLSTIFAHFSESIFLLIFIFFNIAYLFISKRERLAKHLKMLAMFFIMATVISFYFLKLYIGTWIKHSPYKFSIIPKVSMPMFYILDFKLLLLFLIIGLLYGIYLFAIRKYNFLTLTSIIFLILGFGNYFGFGGRAFYLRFYWPILLSPLIAYGIYVILSFFKLNKKVLIYIIPLIIIPLFFSGFTFMPQYQRVSSVGLMDEGTWHIFKWLRINTPVDSKTLFFYGDIYDQTTVLLNSKRLSYKINMEDYISNLKEEEVPKKIKPSLAYMDLIFHQDSFFGYSEKNIDQLTVDLCSFDYYVFNKVGRIPQLVQFNIFIRDFLLEKQQNFKLVYDTPYASILANNETSLNCVW